MVALAILVVALLPANVTATNYAVGDDSGWTNRYDYQAWAKNKVFKAGDMLTFNYPKGAHNVFIVNATSYADCIIPPPSEAYTSGHDMIGLMVPGQMWFICGVGDHCAEDKQKLAINVTYS
ncbi:blue copper protein-like [Rutidosis leptorrhynchoides]|uniref:blue copper protein-like n=1 Tax=Rutidosis leptorrhynchoides TaxID=125765 RepID=UPI003A996348